MLQVVIFHPVLEYSPYKTVAEFLYFSGWDHEYGMLHGRMVEDVVVQAELLLTMQYDYSQRRTFPEGARPYHTQVSWQREARHGFATDESLVANVCDCFRHHHLCQILAPSEGTPRNFIYLAPYTVGCCHAVGDDEAAFCGRVDSGLVRDARTNTCMIQGNRLVAEECHHHRIAVTQHGCLERPFPPLLECVRLGADKQWQ